MPIPARPGAARTLAASVFAAAAGLLLAPTAAAAPPDSLDVSPDSLAEGSAADLAGLPQFDLRAKRVDPRPAWAEPHAAFVPNAQAVRAAEARIEAARAAAEATRREMMGVRYYPVVAEALVAEQAAVAQRHFGGARRRARGVFPMIERTLRRHGLPDDLKYVAVVESALNPVAVSHAGAEGLWQFMPETQADYGLDSLSVRDPALATTAAARYLARLGRQFGGDWQLALAAYNCGPGRVQRIVRAHEAATGERATFWAIRDRLPRETQAYVPRWIAVAEWMEG